MTSAEARAVLWLYRGEQDRLLEGMSKALARLENDPELKGWFDQLQQTRAQERAALRTLAIPEGLRESIRRSREIIPFWQRRSFISALAASVALMVTGVIFYRAQPQRPEFTLANFERRLLGDALRSYNMDLETNDPQVVRQHLALQNAPADFLLPTGVQALPVIGGAALKWHDRPVSMICFKIKNEIAYLFVTDDRNLAEQPLQTPTFGTFAELSTAAWRLNGKVYLLGVKLPLQEVKELVPDSAPGA